MSKLLHSSRYSLILFLLFAFTNAFFRADPMTPFVFDGQQITRNTPLLVDPATGALRQGVRTCTGASDTNCVASYNTFANDPRGIGLDPMVGSYLRAYPAPNAYTASDESNTATLQHYRF